MKIGNKLLLSFILILLLAISLCFIFIFSLYQINDLSLKSAELNNVNKNFSNGEVAHYNWISKLKDFIFIDNSNPLNIEFDDHKCELGKFIYGSNINKVESFKDISSNLDDLKALHLTLHSSGKKIDDANAKDEMIKIFYDETNPSMQKVQENLQIMKSKLENTQEALNVNIQNIQNMVYWLIIVFVTIIFLALIVIFIVLFRSVIKPIRKMTVMIQDISEGDGDLTKRIEIHSKDEIGIMSTHFNKFVDKLENTISHIIQSSDQITIGTSQISDSSQSLSIGASKQAASLEEITASINEIASQVQLNVENSRKTNDLAIKTNDDAIKGDKQMKELVNAMEEINKSAQEIKNIVKVIDDIAFQTNLLALNADIEAARVGKYGRGFAVVANSVRTLAGKSAEAVKETTTMVDKAMKNIENGNELVKKTAEQFDNITQASSEVTKLANEVADASQEQANGIEQISTGLGQIEEVTQSNSANAEENAAASEELASQTIELKEVVSYFKVSMNTKQAKIEINNSKKIKPYKDMD